ncbi:MAG: ligand-gated channel protein [Burkholderiaceae bacterium]
MRRLRPHGLAFAVAGMLAPAAGAQTEDAERESDSLDAVVVTASGFEQAVKDAPASITVVPRAELEKKAYKDVTDMLVDVPGVVITGGGSSSDISIRGMAAGYTMLLVDGRRQNSRETRPNSDGPGIEQGWLPPMEAIERIEVIRGPMSSLYGSDAMGGVVNIITRKVPNAWSGSLRAETQQQGSSRSGDIYQSSFYLGGPIKTDLLGLQLYGQKMRRNEDRFISGFNEQDVTAGTAKLSLTPNRQHDIVAEVGRTLQDRNATAGRSATTDSRTGYSKNLFALSHTGRWAVGTSHSYLQFDETDNPGREMRIKNTEFNSQITMPLGSHMTTLGVAYKNEQLDDQGNQMQVADPISRLERYQWALFAENEWSVTQSFALTGGVRMNHDENYGTNWTPRVYGVWHATEKLSVKGGVSTGFKAPALRSAVADWGQITGGGGDPAVIRGNPSLKPEKSVSQEIGLIWDNRQGFIGSLTAFNTDFKDKITEIRTCSDTASNGSRIETGNCTIDGTAYKFISDRVNVDEATMRGIEATGTWQASKSVRLTTSYTYTHSEQKSGAFRGQPLNKMPRHMFNATADWKVSDPLSAWARMNFRGKTSDYLSRTTMTAGTPSFTFVDLGVNYRYSRNLRFGAGVYNLFDKRVDNTLYGAVYDGRRYWLSMTASF